MTQRAPTVPVRPASVGVADSGSLWPGGVVYYDDNGCIAGNTCPGLAQAVSTFNTDFSGVVQWTERTTETTYVLITLSGTGGQGDVNTVGYPTQAGPVALNCNTDCSVTTLLHEMGHIIGLRHEHVRTDRDSYVTMNYNNVIKGTWVDDFAIDTQNQQLLTPYDYASVMQYPAFVDSSNGGPVIETIPPGIPLQGVEGLPGVGNQDYSAADKEAIERLYGKAPTSVTITSNPIGLQVIVDNQTVTTPQTYNWALNSTHTLSVSGNVQTLTGDIENSDPPVSTTFYYTYGRWNDSTAQTHTITVNPGNGSPAFPSTSPAIATYSANFVQLVPYTESVTPSDDGTVSVSPAPQTYSGQSGNFFVARQNVTLTATPNSDVNFYEFNAQAPYFWLPGGLSANPREFYVPDSGNPVAVLAEFTTYPVYTIDVAPPSGDNIDTFSDNLWAFIDGAYWQTPRSFSADPAYAYDAVTSWAAGTSHTLNVNSGVPEYPYSYNSRFAFSSWSDGGQEQHTITSLPAVSTAYTATVTPQYAPATNFSFPPCGGTAAINTSSPTGDGFYPWGTQLSFTATPNSGANWAFGGWSFDLTGSSTTAQLTADDETLVYANFNANTANAPLTLTSLSPASVPSGSSGFTLTLTGTGFSSDSHISFGSNGVTPVDVVSPTEIQVPVSASWISNPGSFDVAVENFPTGWGGCAVFGYDTFTVTGPPTPIDPWIQVNGGAWQEVSSVSVNAGATVNLGPHPVSGGTWSWTGPNGFTSTSRVLDSVSLAAGTNTYTATYTNTAGVQSNPQAFTITVSTPIVPYIQVNGGAWTQESTATVNTGATVNLGPQPVSGGSWSWTGPNGFSSTARVLYAVPLASATNTYTATYTNTTGGQSTQAFTI
ncbi:MAG: M12 family metallopeptidase, partial [Acidobacteriaceae bacterium]